MLFSHSILSPDMGEGGNEENGIRIIQDIEIFACDLWFSKIKTFFYTLNKHVFKRYLTLLMLYLVIHWNANEKRNDNKGNICLVCSIK